MKKSLLMLGVAAAALASCTNEEVVNVAENRAIGFNSFVDNNTRAVTEVSSLSDFYVFGNYGTSGENVVYNNESSKIVHYWVANQPYKFGAYADGDATKISSDAVSFSPTTGDYGTLTFAGYAPDGKDLVAAVNSHTTADNPTTEGDKVQLTFKHLLSQVKFTFKTTDADAYELSISDLKITGISKATGTFDGNDPVWSTDGAESNGYSYDAINDIADATANYQGSSVEVVIPQAGTDKLTVTFTATVSGAGLTEKSSTFTAKLGYDATKDESTEVGSDNTWKPGYCYNYIATINADQIDPDLENQKIKFETSVSGWQNANDTDNGELSGTPVGE